MKFELKRLVRLAGCGALLCGGLVLAEDAAPATTAPAQREVSPALKELRAQIEAKEKAALEKSADLKKDVDALDAQIKVKRQERTPESRTQARELSKQREEKLVAADATLKELYAKQSEMRRQGGRGQGGAAAAPAETPAPK